MLVVVVAPGNVLIVATLWLLGLAHGVGAALDRQVVRLLHLGLWHRGRANLLIGIVLRPVLPLPSRVLAVVLELTAVIAANDFILRPLWLRTGWWTVGNIGGPRRGIFRAALALMLSLLAPGSAMLRRRPILVSLIGEQLSVDAQAQHTNTCHTPDARLHAIPHCG
ncbi:hypothetical protein PFL02_57040 [Pseudomonas fluorescens]|nr:hypothetical protein PFL02_57040 [Pseudomonas fluorescens]